jgi:tRNA pseudouridine13 synthase
LSVLRSWIFNRLLADRVADGTWQEILEGDVLAPGGDTIDGVPVGPLWGRGREILSGQALSRQEQTLAATVASEGEPADGKRDPAPEGQDTMSLGEVCEALEYAGVDRGQRPLSVVPWDVHCESADETVTLSFSLPVGAYATVMLSNHFDLQDKSVEHRV